MYAHTQPKRSLLIIISLSHTHADTHASGSWRIDSLCTIFSDFFLPEEQRNLRSVRLPSQSPLASIKDFSWLHHTHARPINSPQFGWLIKAVSDTGDGSADRWEDEWNDGWMTGRQTDGGKDGKIISSRVLFPDCCKQPIWQERLISWTPTGSTVGIYLLFRGWIQTKDDWAHSEYKDFLFLDLDMD